MDRQQIFTATAVVCLVNGLFSPLVGLVFALAPVWLPEFVPVSVPIALFLSSVITSFATLLLSGTPAAIYERITGAPESTPTSLYIWLGTAVVMTLPAVPVALSLLG